jgi:hypothetical protein
VLHGLLKFDVHTFAFSWLVNGNQEINCRDNQVKQKLCQQKKPPEGGFWLPINDWQAI